MTLVESDRRPYLVSLWRAVALGGCLFAAPLAYAIETIVCADAGDEIRFSYGIDPKLERPILWVEMQLTGDFGLSTVSTHRNFNGEYVAASFGHNDIQGADIKWRDDNGREHNTMSFRIGRVSEARQERMAGAVSVVAGGVWTVTCKEVE